MIAAMSSATPAINTDFSRGDRSAQNCRKPSISTPARREAGRTVRLEAQVQSLLDRLRPQRVLQARVVGRPGLELHLQCAIAELESGNAAERRARQQLRELRVEHGEVIRRSDSRAGAQSAQ